MEGIARCAIDEVAWTGMWSAIVLRRTRRNVLGYRLLLLFMLCLGLRSVLAVAVKQTRCAGRLVSPDRTIPLRIPRIAAVT